MKKILSLFKSRKIQTLTAIITGLTIICGLSFNFIIKSNKSELSATISESQTNDEITVDTPNEQENEETSIHLETDLFTEISELKNDISSGDKTLNQSKEGKTEPCVEEIEKKYQEIKSIEEYIPENNNPIEEKQSEPQVIVSREESTEVPNNNDSDDDEIRYIPGWGYIKLKKYHNPLGNRSRIVGKEGDKLTGNLVGEME